MSSPRPLVLLFVLLLFSAPAFATPPPSSPILLRVPISGSLEASLQRLVSTRNASVLAAQVARLVRWRGDLRRHLHRGDSMRILYVPSEAMPEVVALSYEGVQLNLSAYRFPDEHGIERFYDEHGALLEPVLLHSPVPAYVQITETMQRGRGMRRHAGIDLKAPEGTPVVAPFAGEIRRINWSTRVNGLCIEIMYQGTGRIARFLHLSRLAPHIRPGVHVQHGEQIGLVGTTGHSNAPHLHYEIRDYGNNPVDPFKVHGIRDGSLDASRHAAFQAQQRAYAQAMLQHSEVRQSAQPPMTRATTTSVGMPTPGLRASTLSTSAMTQHMCTPNTTGNTQPPCQ